MVHIYRLFSKEWHRPFDRFSIWAFLGHCRGHTNIGDFGDVSFVKASTFDIVSMIILQGLLIAILAMLLYNFAIRQLGPAQTAAFGALTPILALIGGFFFFRRDNNSYKIVGYFLVVALGVVLTSGIMEKALFSAAK